MPRLRISKFVGRDFAWEEHKRPIRWAVNILILLLLYWATMSITEYLRQPSLQMLQSPLAGALAVSVETAKPRKIISKVTYTGTVSPFREVTIAPRVQGWLRDFKLYEGDIVKEGQIIARLDRDELQASVMQGRERVSAGIQHLAEAKANLAIHRARIMEAKAKLQEAEANLVYWKKEIKRVEALRKSGAMAESGLNNTEKQLAAAQGKRMVQKAQLQNHEAKLRAAQSQFRRIGAMLKSRRAELVGRNAVLSYTDILSPISGVVAKRYVYSGILVKPGTKIVDIADVRKVRIQVNVPEEDLSRIKVGTMTEIHVPSLRNSQGPIRAQVSIIFPRLDPRTRTSTVEMIVDNSDRLLRPAMFVVVDLILAIHENAIAVPRRAIVEIEGKPTVFVAKGEEAVANSVKLGLVGGDRVEILKGVKKGDLVIFKGNRGLVDGQEVSVVSRR